jgi:ligand-binding SRPBCC domain-containing protein
MPFYTLETSQNIPAPPETVWAFISDPGNLKRITPEHMGFIITSDNLPGKMYAGEMIGYKVSPLSGIKMNWLTEITHVEKGVYFIDEQRIGPYALWHHQHRITPIEGGTLMHDIVTYKPPFGFVGAIANSLLIARKLKQIFEFRRIKLEEIFGVYVYSPTL